MRLTVLGCSGSVNGPGAACSGYLLQADGHQPVLIDCGHGVFGELLQHANPNHVAVLLSHLHADHCMDLPAMLVWRRWAPECATERSFLYGPTGTALRIGAGSSEYPGRVDDISDTYDVREWVDREAVDLHGLHIVPFKVNHPPSTYGLRITGPDGEVFAYSGDTGVCDEVVDLARDADLFLCEASWTHDPDNRPKNLHLSGTEAGRIAARAAARSLALTHVVPWTDSDAIIDEASVEYPGPLQLVHQGQVIEVRSPL
ncbi:MBL fold metallo-hydrolase [Gordonia sp. HY002]|uniref:cyclic nucleotide-degrading phosphodiesterase n=1 Tax=Gordonia zhenghanii TaxID=2911516 RepID=UPI001EF16031|nr:cyclic nucleotide-degrading phosphodiesterase [Gordonia zhenghanii]MCF8569371.1 MBL fold metallo-hydrolase [Gordonia zhenghanii]MCF8603624.1 MBL fold metallo-hydrolase [Gordonia zhenghanii]